MPYLGEKLKGSSKNFHLKKNPNFFLGQNFFENFFEKFFFAINQPKKGFKAKFFFQKNSKKKNF